MISAFRRFAGLSFVCLAPLVLVVSHLRPGLKISPATQVMEPPMGPTSTKQHGSWAAPLVAI